MCVPADTYQTAWTDCGVLHPSRGSKLLAPLGMEPGPSSLSGARCRISSLIDSLAVMTVRFS